MTRAAVVAVLGLVLVWLTGCTSSLTGGSVPIGLIDGTVHASTKSAQPLARVPVVLLDGTGQVLQTTVSSAKGEFAFENVAPGEVEVVSTRGALKGQVRFTKREDVSARLRLVVDSVNPHVVKIKLKSLKPPSPDGSIELDEDEKDAFTVDGEDDNGEKIVDLPVSWAVVGGIGDITPDGHFSAQHPGEGELIVQHNSVREQVLIRVNPRVSTP